MPNTTSNAPTTFDRWPGVTISYDEKADRFSVISSETLCGYFVPRGDVVGDYRNFGEVMTEILNGCDQFVMVILDEAAQNEINFIWEMNIQLF